MFSAWRLNFYFESDIICDWRGGGGGKHVCWDAQNNVQGIQFHVDHKFWITPAFLAWRYIWYFVLQLFLTSVLVFVLYLYSLHITSIYKCHRSIYPATQWPGNFFGQSSSITLGGKLMHGTVCQLLWSLLHKGSPNLRAYRVAHNDFL